ncbi:MAG TPA: hypothetical protein VK141_06980 [Nitrosomonas sp.]|nr:hypothetical protein [Nitrosomonas sp.]
MKNTERDSLGPKVNEVTRHAVDPGRVLISGELSCSWMCCEKKW